MIRTIVHATGALVAASLLALPAVHAQPITYTFRGIGSGSYGAATFVATPFTIAIRGDVAAPGTPSVPGVSLVSGLSGAITIDDVVTGGAFGGPLVMFVNRSSHILGFGSPSQDYLDLFFSGSAGTAVGGYDLRQPFGPVSASTVIALDQFADVDISGTALTFTDVASPTFQAGGPQPTVTPEPASLALVGSGLLVIGVWTRRRV